MTINFTDLTNEQPFDYRSDSESLLRLLFHILDNARSERDVEFALEIYGNHSDCLSKKQVASLLERGLETEKRLGTEVDTWEL